MFQSERYDIIDALFFDKAVTGYKNTNWTANRVTVSETDANGTSLISEDGQGHYWANNHEGVTGSFVCEFDLISYSDTTTVSFRISGTNTHYIQFKNQNIAPNSHIKITYDGSSCNFQINDGEPINLFNASYPSIELALRCYGANDTLKYANFVIYPI